MYALSITGLVFFQCGNTFNRVLKLLIGFEPEWVKNQSNASNILQESRICWQILDHCN